MWTWMPNLRSAVHTSDNQCLGGKRFGGTKSCSQLGKVVGGDGKRFNYKTRPIKTIWAV